jgi:hypothetical protein
MKTIVILGFSRLTDDGLNTKTSHILACMKGNTNFSDATALVTAVTTAQNDYVASLAAAEGGGRVQTAIKNEKRNVLEKCLKDLGLHVQVNCKDNISILLSSGFDARKDNEPVGTLDAPSNFKVEIGNNSGSIELSVEPEKGALVYIFQWTAAPVTQQSVWETVVGQRCVVIKNLTPGKEYAFRAAAKGTSEELIFSDVITHFAA